MQFIDLQRTIAESRLEYEINIVAFEIELIDYYGLTTISYILRAFEESVGNHCRTVHHNKLFPSL